MTKTTTLTFLTLAACATTASATIVGNPLTITAESSLGTASFTVRLQDGTYNPDTGDFSYSRSSPIVLMDDASGRTIATFDSLNFSIIGDPQINLAFSAVAGNATTLFTIASGFNAFAPILNPTVSGLANMTVTDAFGSDGATEHGNVSGPFAYGAFYNGAVMYGNRINDLTAGADNTANSTQFLTGSIVGPVTDMSAKYSFTLSPRDSASGTSVYSIVPTPGALALLGLSGLALTRRRR